MTIFRCAGHLTSLPKQKYPHVFDRDHFCNWREPGIIPPNIVLEFHIVCVFDAEYPICVKLQEIVEGIRTWPGPQAYLEAP
jgi:hypothetical protein